MKFCTEVGDLKSKKAFVSWSKSDDSFPYFAPFYPRKTFSMGRSKYRSNEARGLILAVKSSNDVPYRERLQTQRWKMLQPQFCA